MSMPHTAHASHACHTHAIRAPRGAASPHARHKLADVPALLVQFAGRESELVEKVERKYIVVSRHLLPLPVLAY